MSLDNHESGPFGHYKRGTPGHVLNALCHLGVPLTTVEDLNIGNSGKLMLRGEEYGEYKYFNAIDRPLFRFQGGKFENPVDHDNNYVLVLGVHGSVSLVLNGPFHATPIAWQTVKRCLTNYIRDPLYTLHQNAGAFFQGGSDNENGEFIYVEFWKPEGAQAWLDAYNAELKKRREEENTR